MKIFEFITIKDPHNSFGFQNSIRVNYENNIAKKYEFIRQYCLARNISTIIFTGDVVDSSTEDKWSFRKYRKNKRVLEQLKGSEISLYSNVGNHDMFHGYENSDDTIFGELVHDGVIQNISINPLAIQLDSAFVLIHGVDYAHDNDIVLNSIQEINDMTSDKEIYKIAVLHSNITPDEVSHITNFTYKSLADKFEDIDMFICGHYHLGYKTTTLTRDDNSKVTFINNWNMTRVARDYETQMDKHIPQMEHVVLTEENGKITMSSTTVEIPHVPYTDAFVTRFINLTELVNKSNFFSTINIEDVKEASKLDDIELINNIKLKDGVDDTIIQIAIQYLNNAKQ